ncbi:MAG TPA: response regulator transcription factor [Vicinamibacterales bacterium]|nr:response regulator transcription factor [Vicinamibacterales bacterium]
MGERSVLVVEDDRDLAEMMAWVLTAAGFEVTTAPNGAAGLAALERQPHCLVILDLVMPDVDGFEFRARQREHPVGSRAPVLVVSGRHDAAKLAAGMDVAGFLPKPFTPDDLVAAVTRIAGAAR